MLRIKNAIASLLIASVCTCFASAQAVDPDIRNAGSITGGSASIIDGFITLNGRFEGLAGIDTVSNGGFLSLDTVAIPNLPDALANLTAPFPNGSPVLSDRPHHVAIGVLGVARRIAIEGSTQTSIMYSQPDGTDDLRVAVGVGSCAVSVPLDEPIDFVCSPGGGNWVGDNVPGDNGGTTTEQQGEFVNAFATVVDGRVVLSGEFKGLTGIQAQSGNNHLRIESFDIPEVGTVPSTAPFFNGIAVSNRPNQSVIGVLGRENRLDAAGNEIDTSILYTGSGAELDTGDLSISIGVGNCGPTALLLNTPTSFQCVPKMPEPDRSVYAGSLSFSIEDGLLTANGNANGLTSLLVHSKKSLLAIDALTTDSPFTDTPTVFEIPNVGGFALLSGESIDIAGTTPTSIRFSEDSSVAAQDLSITFKLGGCAFHTSLETLSNASCVGGVAFDSSNVDSQPLFNVGDDGEIQLLGNFTDITSLTLNSTAGALVLDPLSASASGSPLFGEAGLTILKNDSSEISLATTSTISLEGHLNQSGVLYLPTDETDIFSDLSISVRFGDAEPILIPLATALIPEPSATLLSAFGMIGLIRLRPKTLRRR